MANCCIDSAGWFFKKKLKDRRLWSAISTAGNSRIVTWLGGKWPKEDGATSKKNSFFHFKSFHFWDHPTRESFSSEQPVRNEGDKRRGRHHAAITAGCMTKWRYRKPWPSLQTLFFSSSFFYLNKENRSSTQVLGAAAEIPLINCHSNKKQNSNKISGKYCNIFSAKKCCKQMVKCLLLVVFPETQQNIAIFFVL